MRLIASMRSNQVNSIVIRGRFEILIAHSSSYADIPLMAKYHTNAWTVAAIPMD